MLILVLDQVILVLVVLNIPCCPVSFHHSYEYQHTSCHQRLFALAPLIILVLVGFIPLHIHNKVLTRRQREPLGECLIRQSSPLHRVSPPQLEVRNAEDGCPTFTIAAATEEKEKENWSWNSGNGHESESGEQNSEAPQTLVSLHRSGHAIIRKHVESNVYTMPLP